MSRLPPVWKRATPTVRASRSASARARRRHSHLPRLQVPASQTFPQKPQLCGSVSGLTQTPLQKLPLQGAVRVKLKPVYASYADVELASRTHTSNW
jgi:hypothetical protein